MNKRILIAVIIVAVAMLATTAFLFRDKIKPPFGKSKQVSTEVNDPVVLEGDELSDSPWEALVESNPEVSDTTQEVKSKEVKAVGTSMAKTLEEFDFMPLYEPIAVTKGLIYKVYCAPGGNKLSLTIENTSADFVGFDSIVVLADVDKTPLYAFDISSYLHPLKGKTKHYEASPEMPFSEICYVSVVTAYNQEGFSSVEELRDRTYNMYFDPMKVAAFDVVGYNRPAPKERFSYENLDWNKLPSALQTAKNEEELRTGTSTLSDAAFDAFFESILGDILKQLDTTLVDELLAESGGSLDVESMLGAMETVSEDLYDLDTSPTISVKQLNFYDLKYNPVANQFQGKVYNTGSSAGTLMLKIVVLTEDWVELESFDYGPKIPIAGDTEPLSFGTSKDLSSARYVRIIER